jgi:DNA-binding NtrC family response regulator
MANMGEGGDSKSYMTVDGAIHKVEAASLLCVDFVASDTKMDGGRTEASQRSKAPTILLVEDEAFVRWATAEVLESAGYRLVTAGSAAEALDACRKRFEPVDLLLADVVMPGMSGRDLAAEFESCCPSAQILLMSGYPEQLAWCEPSTSGKKYLAKPFSVSMLLQRVREVLDVKLLELEVRS